MKRDFRLHGLTSDHHHALRLARDVRLAVAAGSCDAGLASRVRGAFHDQLAPHFAVEEDVLLPALDATEARELANRTRREHAALRADDTAIGSGDLARLGPFADRLTAHVRFEENELFPACEALLPGAVLDEVLRRAPKVRSRA